MVEYRLLEHKHQSPLVAELNALAKEGWRVVGFSAAVRVDWIASYLAVLDREVADSKEA